MGWEATAETNREKSTGCTEKLKQKRNRKKLHPKVKLKRLALERKKQYLF